MGLVGSVVPLVRCRHHDPVLNLAFDGKVYESPPAWERLVTNRVRRGDLTPARLFADERRTRRQCPTESLPRPRVSLPVIPRRGRSCWT